MASIDPTQEIKRLRAQSEAMKKKVRKPCTRVLDIDRTTAYLMQPLLMISQMRRPRENNLKDDSEKLRTLHGYCLGYRPLYALLLKKAISTSLYFVGKSHETRWFLWPGKEKQIAQRQLLTRDRKPYQRQFQIQYPAREMVHRYHTKKIPDRYDISCDL